MKIYLSHCLSVQDAIIHNETMNTRRTVPGHIVIRVLNTNLRFEGKIKLNFFDIKIIKSSSKCEVNPRHFQFLLNSGKQ